MRPTFVAVFGLWFVLSSLASTSGSPAVPSDMQVQVRFIDHLSSESAKVGQVFHGTLQAPIAAKRVVYPKGSRVTGKVTAVHPSGRLSDPGVLQLVLTSVSNGRSSSPLNTQPLRIKGESHTKANIEKIGGSTAAGAILGAIIGGGKGAAVGAGVGAATGTGVAAASGRKEAKIESEAVLVFVTAASPATVAHSQPLPLEAQQQSVYDEPPAYQDDEPVYRGRERGEDDDRQYDEDHDRRYRGEDDDRDDDRVHSNGHFTMIFSENDRRIIRSCYSDDYSNFPPGLAKKDRLPPGLERHLERNGTLPPGLQKRVRPLPESCERRLPAIQRGWARVVIRGRVMLLDPGDRIVDLFFLHD
jgi:hypothetical protein